MDGLQDVMQLYTWFMDNCQKKSTTQYFICIYNIVPIISQNAL